MVVKRTIVPVGIGAFCLERFFDESTDEVLFLTIYDCGKGRGNGASKSLKKIIDGELDSNHKYVDYLFLSHFDNDHINGLSYLIERKYVNDKTRVILPLIPVAELFLYEEINNLRYHDTIDRLHRESIQMTFVRHVGHHDENGQLAEDNDNLIGNNNTKSQDNIWGIIRRYLVIDSFDEVLTTGKVKGFWKYIPFYLHDNGIFEEFKKYVLDSNPYRVTYNDFFCFKDWTEEKKEWLKRTYQNYKYRKSKYSSEVSPINMNAMLLISRPYRDDIYQTASTRSATYNGVGNNVTMRSSCLYTSDAGLSEKRFLDHVVAAIDKHLCKDKRIGLMQIPHHGSYRCYNPDIYKELSFDALFVNGEIESTNPALSADVINDSWKHNVPLYIVDKEPMNRLCQVIYR